jgi:(1->4)-alpha-D-glucan 1-alpha-D-glucosylmutase
MFLIKRVLDLRRKNKELFLDGEYTGLHTNGKYNDSIIAFARILDTKAVIAIASRKLSLVENFSEFPITNEVWQDTRFDVPELSTETWYDCISGKTVKDKKEMFAGDILDTFPCALLVSADIH